MLVEITQGTRPSLREDKARRGLTPKAGRSKEAVDLEARQKTRRELARAAPWEKKARRTKMAMTISSLSPANGQGGLSRRERRGIREQLGI